MKWFKDLSTRAKLAVAFGLMALLLLAIGGLGDSTASATNDALNLTFNRDMAGQRHAYEAKLAILWIARAYRHGILLPAASDKEAMLRDIDQRERDLDESLDRTLGTLIVEVNRATISDIRSKVPEYTRLGRDAIRLSETDPAKAITTMNAASAMGLGMLAGLDKIIETKNTLAKKAFDDSEAAYARNRMWTVLAVIAAVLLALLSIALNGNAIAKPLIQTAELLERVAQGDLTARVVVEGDDEVGRAGSALNRALDSVCETLGKVQMVSIEVSSAAQELTSAADQISSGAQHQASSLEETAASLEEIGSTVKHNADNAQHAAQLANGARDTAERGGQVVSAAVSAMSEITQSSKKIADIITTIDEIAFQTNLLALNAAVEAARAGEQGRGFGVVAAEVRSLSQRTASAAKEIRGLIADALNKVEVGTTQVNESGSALQEIMKSVQKMTDVVSEIAAASREQDTGVTQVNAAVSGMDQVTQSNASQTEELSATAQSLTDKAGQLRQMVAAFQLGSEYTAGGADGGPVVRRARKVTPPPIRTGGPVRTAPSGVVRSLPAGPPTKASGGEFQEF